MAEILKEQYLETDFAEIVHLITAARQRAYRAVNTELIELYWMIGEYVKKRLRQQYGAKVRLPCLRLTFNYANSVCAAFLHLTSGECASFLILVVAI